MIMLRCLCARFRALRRSEAGPTATEYAVMIALIILVCYGAIQSVGCESTRAFVSVATQM